jgi:alpha-aminoadipic semialdehyde synthase
LLISDISCDVNGSIEFLERTCSIEKPFFQYDPIEQREVASDIGPVGVTVMGTDILPSELPRESSEHFGRAVMGVVRELVQARQKMLTEGQNQKQQHGVDIRLLSPGIANACITRADGTLEAGYRYLGPLMRRAVADKNSKKAAEVDAVRPDCSMQLSLVGHLFDSGTCHFVVAMNE